MARNGTDRRLRALEALAAQWQEAEVLCADNLAAWVKRQREAGDPGGLLADAAAKAAEFEREAVLKWQTTAAPQIA